MILCIFHFIWELVFTNDIDVKTTKTREREETKYLWKA
jgi:hypothetical protein